MWRWPAMVYLGQDRGLRLLRLMQTDALSYKQLRSLWLILLYSNYLSILKWWSIWSRQVYNSPSHFISNLKFTGHLQFIQKNWWRILFVIVAFSQAAYYERLPFPKSTSFWKYINVFTLFCVTKIYVKILHSVETALIANTSPISSNLLEIV